MLYEVITQVKANGIRLAKVIDQGPLTGYRIPFGVGDIKGDQHSELP